MNALIEMIGEAGEEDLPELTASLEEQCNVLEKNLDDTELVTLLGDEEDSQNAILEIHPGAGGTEAQDWAEMLLRMYTRWAARHSFSVEEMDYLAGEEAGVKRVTLRIIGSYAFGLLRSERGIHRLIRISPFDSSGRRHTSFASVDVIPDVGSEIKLDIKESDLRIDTFHASAPCDGSFSLSENVSVLFLPDMESTECLGLARTLREDMGTAGLAGTLAACVVPGGVPGARPAGGTLLKRLLGALKNLPDDGLVHRIASADLSPAPSACAIVRAEEKLFLFGGAAGRAAMRGTKCRKQ